MSTPTLTELPPQHNTKMSSPLRDVENATPIKADPHNQHAPHPLAALGGARKHFLLLIFSIASFVDVCNVSGVAVAVAQIGNDTGLEISQYVWVGLPSTSRLEESSPPPGF
jgi:hypothetical protein